MCCYAAFSDHTWVMHLDIIRRQWWMDTQVSDKNKSMTVNNNLTSHWPLIFQLNTNATLHICNKMCSPFTILLYSLLIVATFTCQHNNRIQLSVLYEKCLKTVALYCHMKLAGKCLGWNTFRWTIFEDEL